VTVGGIENNETQKWWKMDICNRNAAKWKERLTKVRPPETVMEDEWFTLDFSSASLHGTPGQVTQHDQRHSRV